MNKKGFTLIELLAVIVVLGIVLVFTAPNFLDIFKNSKTKSEEAFVKELSKNIDIYIPLYNNEISFGSYGTFNKPGQGNVDVKKGTIKIKDIIDANIMSTSDYVNPGNKDALCAKETEIEVYKDSDFVYCYKIPKESIGCLTQEYLDSIEDNYYVVDTCTWE